MTSLYTEVFETDLRRHISGPEASFALACWELARKGRQVPLESVFRSASIAWLMPDLMILRPQGDGLVYDHYGANIASHAGFDMTGKPVADFKGALGAFYGHCYERVSRNLQPLGTVHRYGRYNERPMWERVILPLHDDQGRVVFYVVNRARKLHDDFTQLSARSRGAAIIALQFLRTPDGVITDAMISGANAPAQKLTGRRLDQLIDQSIRDCFPGVIHHALWDRYLDVAASKQEQAFQIDYRMDGLDDLFDVKLHPFRDGVAIEFSVMKREKSGDASNAAAVAA
jgi:PAS domain-containing protein